jgi:hypothetical protein
VGALFDVILPYFGCQHSGYGKLRQFRNVECKITRSQEVKVQFLKYPALEKTPRAARIHHVPKKIPPAFGGENRPVRLFIAAAAMSGYTT